jgi:hypothetical protein
MQYNSSQMAAKWWSNNGQIQQKMFIHSQVLEMQQFVNDNGDLARFYPYLTNI